MRRLAALALVVGLAAGTVQAQVSACSSLDGPFGDEVHAFARTVIEGMHAENRQDHVREYVRVPGWPTATRGHRSS